MFYIEYVMHFLQGFHSVAFTMLDISHISCITFVYAELPNESTVVQSNWLSITDPTGRYHSFPRNLSHTHFFQCSSNIFRGFRLDVTSNVFKSNPR